METEFYPKEKLKREILNIVGKYLDLNKYKVFFFGSRVNGKAHQKSDIDIGLKGPKEIPLGVMAKIREGISNIPTLYHIDIVDFFSTDKDFQKIAEKNIELINE